MTSALTPLSLDQVADTLERLLLRYEELQKANALLQEQVVQVTHERDALRSRLTIARNRMDALLKRIPAGEQPTLTPTAVAPASSTHSTNGEGMA